MTYKLQFDLLPGEAWFGANINDGWKLPITQETKAVTDTRYISSYNQASPLWLSTKGRYLWSESGYLVQWNRGRAVCTSKKDKIELFDGFETLRGAYLAASKRHFPFDGKTPDALMFRVPQRQ